MKKKIASLLADFFKKDYRKKLPLIYFAVLVLSFILFILYLFNPSLVLCVFVFGQRVCAPAGTLTGLLASFPGYFIVGKLVFFSQMLPPAVSFLLVVAMSAGFYYLVGLFFDKLSELKGPKKVRFILISIFVILLLSALYLVSYLVR